MFPTLFSGIFAGFLGFRAPSILPLSPKSLRFSQGVTEQLGISGGSRFKAPRAAGSSMTPGRSALCRTVAPERDVHRVEGPGLLGAPKSNRDYWGPVGAEGAY